MDVGTIIIIAVVALIIILVFYAIGVYNKLVNMRNKVGDQFAQIDVQLKRRADMIPNLVETVKGYAKHEEKTLKEVVEARNQMNAASGINEELEASNLVTSALNKLFALAESYPDLKANDNFLSLQKDLKETEDKLSYARSFYNDTVLNYNNLTQQFPSNIIAKMFKFNHIDFFKANDKERENVTVKFQDYQVLFSQGGKNMKKIIILITIFLAPFIVKANTINEIDIDIYLDKEGTAHFTEKWTANLTEGTEGYKPYYNLGSSTISNYHVVMNDTEKFTFIDNWNTSASFKEKTRQNGFNYLDDGVELCFGITSYGQNTYTMTYDISNFVVGLTDSQMLYWNLVPSKLSSEVGKVDIKIYSAFAFPDTLDVWGYGQYGAPTYVEGGVIRMNTTHSLKNNEYMTILVKFPLDTFTLNTNLDKPFEDYLNMANTNAKAYDEDEDYSYIFAIIFSILSCLFFPILAIILQKNKVYGSYNLKFGKNGRKLKKDTPYYRDIPYSKENLTMVYWLACQYNMISNKTDFFGAILLKWYKDGNITISKKINDKSKKEEMTIILNNCANISSNEVSLYQMMYEASTGGILERKAFEKWCRTNYKKVITWFDTIIDTETKYLISQNLITKNNKKYEVSPLVKIEAEKVYGVKRFLEDFSRIEDRSSIEVALWEEYLMYAQIFGIAKKVIKEFKNLYPTVLTDEVSTNIDFIYLISYNSMQKVTAMQSGGSYNSGGGGFASGGGGIGSFGGGGGGGGFR